MSRSDRKYRPARPLSGSRPHANIPEIGSEDRAFIKSLVIYEDASILAFDKPAGLSVQGGSGVTRDVDNLLWAFADRKGRRPHLVHRLDRDTSGLLIAAKTKPAAAFLSEAFAGQRIVKTYLGAVFGLQGTQGEIDWALQRYTSQGVDLVRAVGLARITVNDMSQPPEHPVQNLAPDAKPAQTAWRCLDRTTDAQLLALTPRHGRMHQIRAHLSAMGHPLAGDRKYGGRLAFKGIAVDRLHLHAFSLEFPHPDGHKQRLVVEPPLTLTSIWRDWGLAYPIGCV